ncbi:Cullin-3, partial [Nowakowskiella sp. JEL0078]
MATNPRQRVSISVPRRNIITNELFFDEAWERLSTAIREIYSKNKLGLKTLSFEELYRNAYNLVLHKRGASLYTGVENVISEHLNEVVNSYIIPSFPSPSTSYPSQGIKGSSQKYFGGPNFLRVFRDIWDDFITGTMMVRDILRYMDKAYVISANVPPIYDLGLDLFRDIVIFSKTQPIENLLISTLLDQIILEREDDIIDKGSVKKIVEMLLSLNNDNRKSLYHSNFESSFLLSTSEFYKAESQHFLKTSDVMQYLRHVEKRLKEEELRVSQYLYASTEPKLRRVVEEEMLEFHILTLIEMKNSGLISMLDSNKIEDLSRMFKLLKRTDSGHIQMRKTISEHIKATGKTINQTYGGIQFSNVASSDDNLPALNPVKWVESMLELKEHFDTISESAFDKEKSFTNDMNASLESVVNDNSRSPEFVSLFIDENLRKGLKGKSEIEIDDLLDKTITLFRFLGEKDVFERYYKQHLAKRLLFGRSLSEDAERGMISRMKIECGYQFTHKLEGMFNDMRISTETMQEYRNSLSTSSTVLASNNIPIPDLNVNVLTSTFWPMAHQVQPSIHFPPELALCIEKFQKFYLSKHNGRRLTFMHHLGNSDLRVQFTTCRKEINVSTYAMTVLLTSFGTSDDWVAYIHIRDVTAIPEVDLKRTLQSLSLSKYKVLLKRGAGKEVKDDDEFMFNGKFTAALNKIKIPTISAASSHPTVSSSATAVENDEEREATMERIGETRKYQIEAAIVRVMKSRKQLDHNELLTEVVRIMGNRFTPSPAMIKKRVESLIEREYLKRDEND